MHDHIHTYPLLTHPDSELQTHIFVTKRSESQVNPFQSSQPLLVFHEVSWLDASMAARNANNAGTARWNSRHTNVYETRKHNWCYFRGWIVHSFPSFLLFSLVVVGYNCLTNITICIEVFTCCKWWHTRHKLCPPKSWMPTCKIEANAITSTSSLRAYNQRQWKKIQCVT